jgi:hypothetical protein
LIEVLTLAHRVFHVNFRIKCLFRTPLKIPSDTVNSRAAKLKRLTNSFHFHADRDNAESSNKRIMKARALAHVQRRRVELANEMFEESFYIVFPKEDLSQWKIRATACIGRQI